MLFCLLMGCQSTLAGGVSCLGVLKATGGLLVTTLLSVVQGTVGDP